MVVLGISGPERDAAAALMIDGALVAAVTQEACVRMPGAGYSYSGGFPFAAVDACLERAAIAPADVQRVVICDEDGHTPLRAVDSSWSAPIRRRSNGTLDLSRATGMRVGRLHAHASQLQAVTSRGPIVVLDTHGRGQAAVFTRNNRDLAVARPIDHFGRLVHQLQRAAAALGLSGDPLPALEGLASDGQPVYAETLGRGLWYVPGAGIERDGRILDAVYAEADADAGGRLSDRTPLHIKVRTTRTNLAASIVALVGEIACDIASDVAEVYGVDTIGLGGSLFAHHEVLGRMRGWVQDRVRFAPVPDAVGLALGAAIAGGDEAPVDLPDGLSVGRQFSESDVKAALETAHLDYVYEPSWHRIVLRATRLLARGKLVGWFQGAMDFGCRSLGGRSILSDPSGRYARENVNWYLRHCADDSPPPLVMTADAARECLEQPICSPFGLSSSVVKPQFRSRLQAAVTETGRCRVQTVREETPSRLADLLRLHRQRTDVPALLQVDLSGADEPVACTPRDALRTVYSTPVDALFIERFVLMKDYWLLRNDGDDGQ
jgi:carbamoyltransferase